MQTTLRGIANRALKDRTHRFRNLFGLLTVGFLLECWRFINPRAAAGIDRLSAREYGMNLLDNLTSLVELVKAESYRSKWILRKYIPKPNGKLRPLGIPSIADKILQVAVSKILEAIYESEFLECSYGYRPRRGALDAVRDLSHVLRTGKYEYIVEADICGFFDHIDHEKLMGMLVERIDDRPFVGLIYRWLKTGILETDGRVVKPQEGSPQGGIVSPILSNIYLHKALDQWFEEVVKSHCRGAAHLCRYADDFVAAFQYETDAQRFYEALGKRLGKYGLTLAAEKTRCLRFTRVDDGSKAAFEFLGFEFRWGLNHRRKPCLKRRTSPRKYRAAVAELSIWIRKNRFLPKRELFSLLAAKLRGYYQYYGVRGNFERIGDYFHQAKRILFRMLNRRGQRKSHNWTGFAALLEHFKLPRPRICHDF
jgi:group II intron reverse transcriptase/maturase